MWQGKAWAQKPDLYPHLTGSKTHAVRRKYDGTNRLTRVSSEYENEITLVKQANQYDGLNRRIVRDETGDGGELRHFYYNRQWQVLTEADGTGAATAIYSYNPNYVDSVAVRMTPTSGHFYTHDALFNVTSMVDEATDSIVERYSYTPYGEATVLDASFSPVAANSVFGNELLYTGRRVDPATGLQLNRNRFYHQQLGRWVNRDPIGYLAGNANLYGYVGGMPTYYVDPYGTKGIHQSRYHIKTKGGREYDGTKGGELRDDLGDIAANDDKICKCDIKGHGGPDGISGNSGTADDTLFELNKQKSRVQTGGYGA